jgi:U6 snRNA-associated Sm-like protein LSm1
MQLAAGYRGVYNATPPPQAAGPPVLGGARGPPPQQVLPIDLPPQAFLTSAMLLDMVDSTHKDTGSRELY